VDDACILQVSCGNGDSFTPTAEQVRDELLRHY
jgi:hypothetical protein